MKNGLPNQYESEFKAKVPYYSRDYKSSDGSPVTLDPMSLPSLQGENVREPHFEPVGYIRYNGEVTKLDGEWTVHLEWVHFDGTGGTRITLPHKAVMGLLRAVDSVNKKSRKAGAKQGAQTRANQGIEPFGGKYAQSGNE